MRLALCYFIGLLSFGVFAQDSVSKEQIEQRIQPVGQVTIADSKQINNPETIEPKTAAEKSNNGQSTYERFCIVCHRDGLAGAPKFADEKDWKQRLTGKTIDDLLASVNKGLNAMPAKGTCVECSDEDLKAAIQYMLPKS
jgi:cytochrome c5